mgnify:CR=1 FL=1
MGSNGLTFFKSSNKLILCPLELCSLVPTKVPTDLLVFYQKNRVSPLELVGFQRTYFFFAFQRAYCMLVGTMLVGPNQSSNGNIDNFRKNQEYARWNWLSSNRLIFFAFQQAYCKLVGTMLVGITLAE